MLFKDAPDAPGKVNGDVVRQLTGNSPMAAPKKKAPPAAAIVQATPSRPKASSGRPLVNTASKALPPEPAPAVKEIAYPQDPEPSDYVYKEKIQVADRLAKGNGAVYLVASSHTDPGTMHIYLKGSKYLEFPVLSMFNYISSSTVLCPQFKEEDSVSIVTTSLVFGSQEKIVKFMKAVKTLQARKPATDTASAKPSTPAPSVNGAASVSHANQETDKSIISANVPLEQVDRVSEKPANATSSIPGNDSRVTHARETTLPDTPEGSVTIMSASMDISPKSTSGQKQQDFGVACDLLDLSQPEETAVSKDVPRSGLSSSAYATDLGSLQFSFSEALSTSFVSNNDLGSLHESRESSGMVPAEAETPQTEVSQPEVSMPTTLHKEPPQPQTSLPVTPEQSSKVEKDTSVGAIAQIMRLESLQSSLRDILPTFGAMSKTLGFFDEKDRETVAKSVFAKLKQEKGEGDSPCLLSAEHLLRALLATSKKDKVLALTSLPISSSESHLRYTRREIMFLRGLAVPPPDELFKLDFLPRTAKAQVSPISSPQRVLGTPKKYILKPEAKPFQPSPVSVRTSSEPKPQFASFKPTSESQVAVVSPTALSQMSIASNSTNIDSLTAHMARLALPSSKPETPVRGLGGSRWATTNDSARTENANRFMGIDISP
ncbi:hypothetical protein SEUCBS140593_006113 [Sporothrix eucalyptigena]|uniref:GRAM domain-containing protein n=1 Tax=Sporothrix eucalyptigena TaxID=1812306 RepID=A0ABP0C235_9PEZI